MGLVDLVVEFVNENPRSSPGKISSHLKPLGHSNMDVQRALTSAQAKGKLHSKWEAESPYPFYFPGPQS